MRLIIFIGEADKYNNKILYHELMEMLRKEKIAGATVLRGIAGFGAKSHMHTANILSLTHNLPLVVEVVDNRLSIDKVLPKIKEIVRDGSITLEKVQVIHRSEDN